MYIHCGNLAIAQVMFVMIAYLPASMYMHFHQYNCISPYT